jgi:hypothetical protein
VAIDVQTSKVFCANCGIEIRWQPTIVDGKVYCCLGCSQGGPCTCDYSNLPQPGDATAITSFCHPQWQAPQVQLEN